ncbi:GDP-mannose--glycolipid 4-beta-D-mannosyltransferase [soil metagenome]
MIKSLLSFPGGRRVSENPYVQTLSTALDALGVEVRPYQPLNPLQSADALHIHWLEMLYMGRFTSRSAAITEYACANMMATMGRIKRRGGRVVWTAHNLKPHEPPPGAQAKVWSRWRSRLMSQVDSVICMSPTIMDAVREANPEVAGARFVHAPHPHMRLSYTDWASREATRGRLDVPESARLTGVVGLIRPYKNVPETIALFNAVRREDEYLLVAGQCFDPATRAATEAASRGAPGIRLVMETLTDQDFASFLHACDNALFNFPSILNSGSLMTALSLDVPVMAPRRGGLGEIGEAVGEDWCQLFEPPLTDAMLRALLDRGRAHKTSGRPDLSAFEPSRVAEMQVLAYE